MRGDTTRRAVNRLKIIEGQIRGLQKMVERDKYCIDIISQASAARQALSSLEDLILRNHLETHVVEQIKLGKVKLSVKEILSVYRTAKNK